MTLTGRVLLVDDEEKIVKTLGRALREEGHLVTTTSRAVDGQRLLAEHSFDLLVIDYRMPDRSGMDVVKELVATTPESERPAIVMMTAHGSVESAVEAMKLGAHDYLQKPFEIDELLLTARRALAAQRARTELTYLRNERDAEFDHYGIVGRSKVMVEISRRIELVAQSRSTVLLTGETGTGKELVARAIHDRSQQRHLPLIKVNCAAIPETLIESELFGHVRGAFTGAISAKKGRFALADGGTIFLDEIATLGAAVQSKLLRVLQEREFEPLGSERTEKVDLRVIAATNRDLRTLVGEGRFQEDLYYRLHVIPDRTAAAAPAPRRPAGAGRSLRAEVRPAPGQAHPRRGRAGDGRAEALPLAGQRARAREHDRARRRPDPGTAAHPRLGVADGGDAGADGRPAVTAPASERRMGRARDDPPRPGAGARHQEGRRRADGPQPARAQPLPRQASDRLTRGLTRAVTDYGRRNPSSRIRSRLANASRAKSRRSSSMPSGTPLAAMSRRRRAIPTRPYRCEH